MNELHEIMGYKLEDDNTAYGGIMFPGETVRDFIYSIADRGIIKSVEDLNAALIECGIKPVHLKN